MGGRKSEWRSLIRGNAPVRFERGEGEWVEVRSTRIDEQAMYEVVSAVTPTKRFARYDDALSTARRVRTEWDRLAKRPRRA